MKTTNTDFKSEVSKDNKYHIQETKLSDDNIKKIREEKIIAYVFTVLIWECCRISASVLRYHYDNHLASSCLNFLSLTFRNTWRFRSITYDRENSRREPHNGVKHENGLRFRSPNIKRYRYRLWTSNPINTCR